MTEANDRRILRLNAEPGAFPELAPWLGALQASRHELLDVLGWLPFTSHDETGRLQHVPDVTLDEHRARLQLTRDRLLNEFSKLRPDQWDELSAPAGEDYAVTPGWINYHLLEHEAGHRAEILRLVRKWVGRPITR